MTETAEEAQRVVYLWQDGWRTGLVVTEGYKWVSVITLRSEKVTVTRIPASEVRSFRQTDFSPVEYRKLLRKRAKRWGCTLAAKPFIKG